MFRKRSATHVGPTDPANGDAERWGRLMASAQDGDQHDYRILLEEIAPYLRGVCRRYLGYDEEVEDVVQDILLTVHSIRHTYERTRPFKPWLYTIARRRIADWVRRRSRRLRREEDDAARAVFAGAGRPDEGDAQPELATMRAHAAQQVRHAIDALPLRQREAITLLRLDELTLDEATRATRQTAGALKVACHRALKSLQLAFDREHDHD
jgi:RNA polymerase sigma factor (sigma-70 family)